MEKIILDLISKVSNYAGNPDATVALIAILSILAMVLSGFVIVIFFLAVRFAITGTTKPLKHVETNESIELRGMQHNACNRLLEELRDIVNHAVEEGISDDKILKMTIEAVVRKSKTHPKNPFIRNLKRPENIREVTREFIEDELLIKGIRDEQHRNDDMERDV
ncbi:hypothetical protein [Vibrio phage BONAISHI]|nr:hypothetical protein [Vibrio phage BONAISHI]